MTNPHESLNRLKKALRLVQVLRQAGAGPAGVPLGRAEVWDFAKDAAKVKGPSEETKRLVNQLLNEGRASE